MWLGMAREIRAASDGEAGSGRLGG
jgi:hypothetical protein